jgi:ketosteroid isomerase-like protein
MTESSKMALIADRLTAAFAAKDLDALAALYAEDIRVWHNYDRTVKDKVTNLAMVAGFFAGFETVAYTHIKRQLSENGFTQEHIVSARRADGTHGELPCCVVVYVEHGQISYLNEYIDSAQIAAFFAAGA